jgi:superfamily II DNA helicase RecQ
MVEYGRMLGRFLCFAIRTHGATNFKWTIEHPYWTHQVFLLNELQSNSKEAEVDSERMIELVHETFKEFINWVEHDSIVQSMSCPLFRFLVLSSINAAGTGFVSVKEIPRTIAKLQYCIRANIYEQCLHLEGGGMVGVSDEGGLFGLKQYVVEAGQTPFHRLRQLMYKATSVAQATPKFGQVNWRANPNDGDDYSILEVNGRSLAFKSIAGLLHGLLQRNERRLYDKLLIGVPLPEFDFDRYEPEEFLSSQTFNHSIFNSDENKFMRYRNLLIDHWLSSNRCRQHYVRGMIDGEICWNRSAVMKWLDYCLEFLEEFLVEMHLDYGQPARAAEISVLRITNGSDGQRNVYFYNGTIMLLFLYSKNRWRKDRDRVIPRYLSPKVKLQFIVYMTFVRPTISYFMKKLKLPGREQVDEFLFVDHKHGLWNADRVRSTFKRVTARDDIGLLEFKNYRQVATLIMEKKIKYKQPDLTENYFIDLQAGHSSHIAEMEYAVAKDGSQLATRNAFHGFYMCSASWWDVMGMLKMKSSRMTINIAESTIDSRSMEDDIPIQSTVSIHTLRSEITMQEGTINPYVEVYPNTVLALQKLFNDSNARFKSIEQASAVQHIINRTGDTGVILETGGGKSMMMELPALMEPRNTSVVIVPFVALMTEMKERLQRVGLTIEEWNPDKVQRDRVVNLLLVSAEHAISDPFRVHLIELESTKHLSRIYMDEAHTLLTQSDFRKHLRRMISTLRAVEVPIVLLSATIPPSMIADIRIRIGSVEWAEFRRSTDRPNLEYNVMRVANEEIMDSELCDMIKRAIHGWKTENDRVLVYCLSHKQTKEFSALLNSTFDRPICGYYHSGMKKEEKEEIYKEWKRGTLKVLSATSALGAGLDHSTVRQVFHRGHASSQINYVQEVGRAGRDGGVGECTIVYCSAIETDSDWMKGTGRDEHLRYIHSTECRRGMITKEMDGRQIDCFMSRGKRCDSCRSKLTDISPISIPKTYDGSKSQSFYRNLKEQQFEMIERVKQVISTFDGFCIVCWAQRKVQAVHDVNSCHFIKNRCSRCFDKGHWVRSCNNGTKYNNAICCYICGFPQTLYGEYIHGEASTGACDLKGLRDCIIPSCWLMWRDTKAKEAVIRNKFDFRGTEEEFSDWIGDSLDGEITNGLSLLVWWVFDSEE